MDDNTFMPGKHQIGQQVHVAFTWPAIPARVIGVSFKDGVSENLHQRTKYDLELHVASGSKTRVYGVDSDFVVD